MKTMQKTLATLLCLLLVACVTPATKPTTATDFMAQQIQRELLLQKQTVWSFNGRLAVSDGRQAGTVKMRWQQRGEQFDIEIALPISNQRFRLRSAGSRVRLESLGLTMFEGESAEAVLQQATGLRIPFKDMQLWVRGMRTQALTPVEFAPSGLPAQFRENGWLVDYREWNTGFNPMPVKVFASSNVNGKNASVKLQVDAWETL